MLSLCSNKKKLLIVLSTFVFYSAIPVNTFYCSTDDLDIEKQAIFGLCKLKRLKRRIKNFEKAIEEFKKGKITVEEMALQLTILKQKVNKYFEYNIKIQEVMEIANNKIEDYFCYNVKDKYYKKCCKYGASDTGIDHSLEVDNLSINRFLTSLQRYEDSKRTINSLEKELKSCFKKGAFYKKSHKDKDDDESSNVVFAYVSIFCGCLLWMIPHPLTQNIGKTLVGNGLYLLGNEKWNELNEENQEKKDK